MGAFLDTFRIIALIAMRNLVASRLKTIIVGGIIFFGALLVVMGTSLLDSVDQSMSRSIISVRMSCCVSDGATGKYPSLCRSL